MAENPVPHREAAHDNKETQRVQDFQELLGRLKDAEMIDSTLNLADDDPVHDAVKYFGKYVSSEPTLHLDAAHQHLYDAGTPTFVPLRSRGGKRSAHGVVFGELHFEDGDKIAVAVKPHDIDPVTSCAKDYYTNAAAQQLELRTLDTIGMITDGHNTAYSLSVLEKNLTTLDSIDWRYMCEYEPDEVQSIWGQVARFSSLLHSIGKVKHGDLAARNIAITYDQGAAFGIDWEHGSMSTQTPRDPEVRYTLSRADMGELMESMMRSPKDSYKGGIGLIEGSAQERWTQFSDLVFTEYRAMRLQFAAKKGPTELQDVQDELQELEASLKSHIRTFI